ncbi:MAG: cation-transporting P-type ATPase [Bacteroidales bacterium]
MEKEKENNNKKWHALSVDEVIEIIQTNPDEGLSDDEVKKRLEKYGRNEIPKGKKRSTFQRLLAQFQNTLIYVLLVAALITALIEHWIDMWVILAVVIINAVIGFIQEGRAEKALEDLQDMLSLDATVIRKGEKMNIDAEELVPGDVVLMKSGNKIPADVRIIKSRNFSVEESPLTGESEAVEKNTDPVEEDAVIGDRASMGFSSTMVTYGNARGVVVKTGTETEIGKINKMMSEVEELTTPLLQKIQEFSKWLSVGILGIAAIFFAFGFFVQEYELYEMFLIVISLVVAAIPSGLPAVITIALAVAVRKMAGRNAIIRRLPSVETLGAVNVIYSDKTGTLTRNEMTAKTIITADKEYTVEGTGYVPEGKILEEDEDIGKNFDKVLKRLFQASRVCNNSEVYKDEEGNWKLSGTPTEGALLTLSYKAGFKDFKPNRIDSIPFESDHKYMATLNKINGGKCIFVSGAPERLLKMSHKQYTRDGEKDIDTEYWEKKMEQVAAKGQRLLAVAFQKADDDKDMLEMEDAEKDNIFIGIIGIIDPPRQEAVDSVKECKEAGIMVKMITGDHVITAKAIGKEIGIGDGEKALSGKELEEMDDEKLREAVDEYDVYARASPEHKLRLVEASQKKDWLCAMTGDGVNDAPALKKANIGIAMGIKGTEVSKEASEMVLADDNFASIVNAVEEGRTVFDNIRKALLFVLPTNGAESLVLIAAILLGMIMPITPVQILWVNMVTAVTLAMAIAFEPMEEDVMLRTPRKQDESLLSKMFIWRIVFVSFLVAGATFFTFEYLREIGREMNEARTIAVNTLVAGQMFYLLNCRKIKTPALGKGFFNNRSILFAFIALILFQLFFVYVPFMNAAFGTSPVEATLWLYPLAAGLLVFITVELEKFIVAKIRGRRE